MAVAITGSPRPRLNLMERLLSLPTLSLLIASLSLISSISQSYNYRRNIAAVQQNVLRAENLKTCRDIIEVFFAFRLRAEEINARQNDGRMEEISRAEARRELKSLVYRFGALGTFLANFTPDKARERYSRLSWDLNALAEGAMTMPAEEFAQRFGEADKTFATLNEDCARSAQFISLP
jgi:hypothetical protein